VTNASLDAELEDLKKKANALKSSAEGDRKVEVLRFISEVGKWMKTVDVDRKKEAVERLRERYAKLAS
jgi:hypothetical protein